MHIRENKEVKRLLLFQIIKIKRYIQLYKGFYLYILLDFSIYDK